MKHRFFFMLLAVFTILLISSRLNFAQHEMVVNWDDGSGNIVQDALYNAVMGDTAADGSRLDMDRVYILKAGGYYWDNATISNDFPLRLVGEEPDATTPPATVQMVLDIVDGSAPGKMISCSSDLTLKNLYIIGSDEVGTQTYYQPIEVNAVGKRYVFDNCIFERSNFSMVAWAGGSDNDIFITNCEYRNMIEAPPTQQWAGRGISIWTDADTVVIENNTFFNVNFTAIQIENGAANYLRVNHNTVVNVGRALSSTTNVWWREAYFTNLLLVNVYWHGDAASELDPIYAPNRDPRAYYTGMFPVITMPSRYGTNTGRRILFSHTAAFLDNYFKTQYDDSIRVQPYINAVTDSFFNTYSPANGGQMVISDTSWLGAYPNFTSNPDDQTQIETMYNHITASRGYQYYGTGVQANTYFWGLNSDPSIEWTVPVWPRPENFAYDDASLMTAGTDGLPLGDLNWFPNAKTDFETNKDAYVKQIENMPGGRVVENVVYEDQAENGTLGGTAAVSPFTGTSWYTLVGGSSVQWTFNSTYAGPYDIKFMARADGQNIGFDFLVNDEHVVDAARGWGQFVVWTQSDDPQTFWTGKSLTEFYEAAYANAELKNNDNGGNLSLVSGENTLKLQYSWNSISFQWVEFYEAGTTNLIARLIPPDAVNNGSTPAGQGTWVPLGFNSVALGSGGTVSFDVDFPQDGTYKVRDFFQNPDAASSGTVSLDGNQVATLDFGSKPDSTGADYISGLFDATAGTHTLTISGSGAKLDWMQVILQTITSVRERPDVPHGYALAQNYPNPFNPTTTINFDIGKPSTVKLTVYNILGQRIATLVNSYMNAGAYAIPFDGANLASGVYFYRLEAGSYKFIKKMMLLK